MEQTYYETLEVSELASVETIRAAYRSLSKRFHPDNNETGNKARFEAINSAHETLTREDLRRVYDLELKEERRRKTEGERQQTEPISIPAYDPAPHVNTIFTLGAALLSEQQIHPMIAFTIQQYQPDLEKFAVSLLKKAF